MMTNEKLTYTLQSFVGRVFVSTETPLQRGSFDSLEEAEKVIYHKKRISGRPMAGFPYSTIDIANADGKLLKTLFYF